MIKLKEIKLVNYCGYKDFKLNLMDNDKLKKWIILYGQNGTGKSNFIRAVSLLSSPKQFTKKKNILTFRKLKYHHDYIFGAETMYDEVNELKMEATFIANKEEKKVVLEDNIKGVIYAGRKVDEKKGEISGVKINQLQPNEQGVVFIDADCRNMMQKFQIISDLIVPFCEFSSAVYGCKCYCPEGSRVVDHGIEYCIDFIIEKRNGTKVHYKRFSDGEKKIATLISSLFKRVYKDSPDKEDKDIVLIDNIAQHIYYLRHMSLIEKINEYFPDKQFIATTHSPVIINEMDKKYLVNMEDS